MSSIKLWFVIILLPVITNISTAQPSPCLSYKNRSESWRNVGFCEYTQNKNDLEMENGWYRFIGAGGDQVVSSCARTNTSGIVTIYNLFMCNSNINYTEYTPCSGGFTVYYLRPTSRTYATRHSNCSNSSSCGDNAQCGIVYGSCVCKPGLKFNISSNGIYECTDSTNNSELITYGNTLLAVTEKLLAAVVTKTESQSISKILLEKMEAEILAVGSMTSLNNTPLLNTSNSFLNIDLIGMSRNNNGSASVVFVSYNDMHKILKPSLFKTTINATKTMMSKVVSVTLPKVNNTFLTKPVNLTFNYTNALNPEGNLSCVYWNESEWVEYGCSISEKNSTYTVCSCTHLSTFALIMSTNSDNLQDKTEDDATDLFNTVAVSVGLVFLTLTVLTLAVCQRGPKITNAALLNLCISLFFAHLTFLLTQKLLQSIKEHTQICLMLAGVIHFLFLSAFVWMFIEAVLLYIFVKNLSRISSRESQMLSWKCMIVIGYIIPLAMVGVTSGLYPDCYNREMCWLETSYVWSFLGPVACIIGINLLLSCVIFMNLKWALARLDKTVSQLKQTQTLVFKTLLQFIILGCPWALGFFVGNNSMIKIVFLFLNSQQGTFIFIVHCVLNQEVRRQYKQWWFAFRHNSKYKSMEDDQTKTSHSHSN
ncbi:adhesion G protein-coupled receptor E3-like [Clarias gariepinus]|uniref:adhesion G protein-coupled receptor E3-like n=1 Tax=Clarias gariepinus TaxID=13013 RepID=UPI00234CF53D|nr:adhesion G protein-coupled receptor E3-like [Clarias gariepinus]